MTLKELLDEQERKVSDYFGDGISTKAMEAFSKGEDIDRAKMKELQDFLRQNTIDTVKWVIKLSTELEKEKWETGKVGGLIDLISELNKSIEDHA